MTDWKQGKKIVNFKMVARHVWQVTNWQVKSGQELVDAVARTSRIIC